MLDKGENVEARVSRRQFLWRVGVSAGAASALGRGTRVQAERKAHHPALTLRFGIHTLPQHGTYTALLQAWQVADRLGFDSAFLFDHLMPIEGAAQGSCLEGWTLLAALAAQTKRMRVGVLVTGNTYRHPAVLAKMTATVDHISHGRLILGLGAGWFEREHIAYGIPFFTPGERARRLAETVAVLRQLFVQESSTFTGRYYQLQDAPFAPRSLQQPMPPLLIGGMGIKRIQPLAARYANLWHCSVEDADPLATKAVCARFDDLCHQVGRNPQEVEKVISLDYEQLTESTATVRGWIRGLVAAGIQHFVLTLPAPYDRKLLTRFTTEIRPTLRGG